MLTTPERHQKKRWEREGPPHAMSMEPKLCFSQPRWMVNEQARDAGLLGALVVFLAGPLTVTKVQRHEDPGIPQESCVYPEPRCSLPASAELLKLPFPPTQYDTAATAGKKLGSQHTDCGRGRQPPALSLSSNSPG